MEANTAAIWIVYRIGKQVVYIDQHGRGQYQVGRHPAFPKEKASEQGWNEKVQG